jgi:hypothetical protein
MVMSPGNKSKFAALVVKSMPKPSSRVGVGYESSPQGGATGERNDKALIADDILNAIHGRDADAFSDALCAFIKLCDSDDQEGDAAEASEAPEAPEA